jgi:hypothetical protein
MNLPLRLLLACGVVLVPLIAYGLEADAGWTEIVRGDKATTFVNSLSMKFDGYTSTFDSKTVYQNPESWEPGKPKVHMSLDVQKVDCLNQTLQVLSFATYEDLEGNKEIFRSPAGWTEVPERPREGSLDSGMVQEYCTLPQLEAAVAKAKQPHANSTGAREIMVLECEFSPPDPTGLRPATITFNIDLAKATVNGWPAHIDDQEIRFEFGEKRTLAVINRYTGSLRAPPMRPAKCKKYDKAQF